MNKYTIEITETLQRQIEIKANSHDEALKIIKEKYKNEEIVLTADDFIDVEFKNLSKSKTKNTQIR